MSRLDLHVYRDTAGKHHWAAVSENGNILADSGQGYARRIGALKGFDALHGHRLAGLAGTDPDASVTPCPWHDGTCQLWRCWT